MNKDHEKGKKNKRLTAQQLLFHIIIAGHIVEEDFLSFHFLAEAKEIKGKWKRKSFVTVDKTWSMNPFLQESQSNKEKEIRKWRLALKGFIR